MNPHPAKSAWPSLRGGARRWRRPLSQLQNPESRPSVEQVAPSKVSPLLVYTDASFRPRKRKRRDCDEQASELSDVATESEQAGTKRLLMMRSVALSWKESAVPV